MAVAGAAAAAACLILYVGLLASRAVTLNEPTEFLRSSWNHGYLLLVSCSVIGLIAIIRPQRRLFRLALLVVVFAALIVVNSADLTVTNYFAQPLIRIYDYIPEAKVGDGSIGSFISYYNQFVPIGFLGVTAIFCLPAFWLLYVIDRVKWRPTFLSMMAIAVIGFGFTRFERWNSPEKILSPAETKKMLVNPWIPQDDYEFPTDRSSSIDLLDEVKYAPRTIVLVINESVGYFFPSSRGEGTSLIDRLVSISGSETGWHKYRNAVTNSSATDVSLPSLLTGSGAHESFAKLRLMPAIFDIAKERGYETAFYTSSTMDWGGFREFFGLSRIDHTLTGSDTDQPYIVGLAIDDIYITKRLASFIQTQGDRPLLVVFFPNALHVPFQTASEIEIPSALTERRERSLYILESAYKILFDALRKAGRYDDAMIVITGDHGGASDPDPRGYSMSRVEDLGEEILRVTFLIKEPAGMPAEMSSSLASNTDRLVSNLDIAPTIADLLGVGLKSPLKYQGYSLFERIPDDRLAIAANTNDWRDWSRSTIAFARRRERFVCWSVRLCEYSRLDSLENPKATPLPDQAPYTDYLKIALSLPIVAQSVSKIYHDYYQKTWRPGDDGERVVPPEALFSSLGNSLPTESTDYILQAEAGHTPEHIIFGPYWELPVGGYRASVSLEIGDGAAKGEMICRLEVYNGEKAVVWLRLLADAGGASHRVELPFSVTEADTGRRYEIRLWCSGRVSVAVKEVGLRPGVDGEWVVPRQALYSSLGDPPPTGNRAYVLQAEAGHAPGYVIYGPYWELPAGEYRTSMSLEIGDGAAKDEVVCVLDVYNGEKVVFRREILADDRGASHRVVLPFSVAEDDTERPYETRLWCGGRVSVTVKEVGLGPGADGEWFVPRQALYSSLGDRPPTENRDYILQAEAGHGPGYVIYGPYWELPVGAYRARMSLETGDGAAKGEVVCVLDIYNGEKVVFRHELLAGDGGASHRVVLPFSVTEDDAGRLYEIRLWCSGGVSVAVKEIAIL